MFCFIFSAEIYYGSTSPKFEGYENKVEQFIYSFEFCPLPVLYSVPGYRIVLAQSPALEADIYCMCADVAENVYGDISWPDLEAIKLTSN